MELSALKGIGPTRLARFRAMGINTLRDLLFFFPKKYEDHIHVTTISSAEDGAIMVHGTVVQEPKITYYHGISVVSTTIQDDSGSLLVRWYNEPWMMQQLSAGQILFLYGNMTSKKGRYLQNPKIITQFGFMPVYRAIRGYPNKSLQQLLRNALYAVETVCPETLPSTFLHRNHLISLSDALRNMHFPDSLDNLKKAIRRIEFERMLMYLMGVSIFRHLSQPGLTMGINGSDEAFFWENVPFSPTAAQRRVLHEISEDLKREQAMSRLVQGDVGCGKTIIAFGAIYLTVKQGYQAAMMAPTDILARQHYENALSILRPLGISCELLTGNTKAAERRRILNAIK
ncbi:MAG: DEAD/DEAH box helicase, partial [Oscillospiraceae bacterium]|nr:DEAD/DEAH box helicase [Oscillospiraceae bacterium]